MAVDRDKIITGLAFEKVVCLLQGLTDETSSQSPGDFQVKRVRGRGRSVFAKREFQEGDYVTEYKGQYRKYEEQEFNSLQRKYEAQNKDCYVLRFLAPGDNEQYYIDATEDLHIAKFINHVRNPNLKPYQPVKLQGEDRYRIAFYACRDIHRGDELFWDYFYGEDPLKVLDLKIGQKIPSSLSWIYSVLLEDGSVVFQSPLSLSHQNKPKPKLMEIENDPYNFSDDPVMDSENFVSGRKARNVALRKMRESQRNSKQPQICTICYKVCMKLSHHLTHVHGVKGIAKKRSELEASRELTKSVISTSPTSRTSSVQTIPSSSNPWREQLQQLSLQGFELWEAKRRKELVCPYCSKETTELSVHLSNCHNLFGQKRT